VRRTHPAPGSHAARVAAALADLSKEGLAPLAVAKQVVTAIRCNELYVFTHAGSQWRTELEHRFNNNLFAMDRTATGEGLM
jgi:hypothetical protein